jgi:putative inorganic carbon (HCO3(-)) transporter
MKDSFWHTEHLQKAAFLLVFASAVTILFSIAASQILLALALVALLLSGAKIRVPPNWLPLAVFLGLTLVSLALSPDPAAGLPQVRKMYVFTILPALFSLVREPGAIRNLVLGWAGAGALVALRALVQFGVKLRESRAAGQSFYEHYVGDRITGFMSHWMTFGGEEMIVLLMVTAFLLFAPRKTRAWAWLLCLFVMAAALLLGFTRSIWIAAAAGCVYLLWHRKRALLWAAPVALAAGFAVAPGAVRSRLISFAQPGRSDSNQHRVVSWRTGLAMIAAHPWFGLGPEQVGRQFQQYVPADIPRPLPLGFYGHLHNIYLHYAAERGVPAMLALTFFLFRSLYDLARSARRAPPDDDRRFILHGAAAVVLATMLSGVFELNLGDSEVLTMFLAVLSCGYVAAEEERAHV